MNYEWDEDKNIENQQKHDIEFSEVIPMLESADPLVEYDSEHSELGEDRFKITGVVGSHGVVVVIVTDPDKNTTRIISARKV